MNGIHALNGQHNEAGSGGIGASEPALKALELSLPPAIGNTGLWVAYLQQCWRARSDGAGDLAG